MNDGIPGMDEEAQHLYLSAMLGNPDIFARAQHLISPTHFDPQFAKGVKYLKEYFQEYHALPAESIFKANTKLPIIGEKLNATDSQYVLEQIASFCQFKEVVSIIQKTVGQGGYLEKKDYGEMMQQFRSAMDLKLQTDLGIEYFENVESRLESYDNEDKPISTGWKSVDDLIGGGVGRQELILFLAPSGGGKSVGMLNLGRNLMKQGLSGVYVSLEMKDKKVALRTDQMMARMASGMVTLNKTEVAHEIHKFHEQTGAKLFIKRMRESTTTAADIGAYLKELEVQRGFKPDWIVMDYLDIMAPTRRVGVDNMFLKDKYVSEESRAIGMDYDAIVISGSQLGKHATEAINEGKVIHQGDVQGGSSKTNTSDLQISMEKTEAMHEAGEYRFGFPKARNSDATGKRVTMRWNKTSLIISDLGDSADALEFKAKSNRRPPLGGLGAVVPGKSKSIDEMIQDRNLT